MAAETFRGRVRIGAMVLGAAVLFEMFRYTYTAFRRAIRFCFGEPERWNEHFLVDDGVMIDMGLRIGYFIFWAAVILASVAVFAAAILLLRHFAKGEIFTQSTANGIMWVGGLLVFAMLIDTVFMFFDVHIITLRNAEPNPPGFVYDPSDIKSTMLGAILFLFGGVMREATAIDAENREIV